MFYNAHSECWHKTSALTRTNFHWKPHRRISASHLTFLVDGLYGKATDQLSSPVAIGIST
eukprot:COSAG02_NODE_29483_length_568_cov_0.982942_1_plen_59_part_10